MTEHRPNCEDATGAYPGSCTCKTIAMDNLIAQDADLIDSPLVDRLRWVSEWYFVDPVDGTAYASDDPLDAADRIEELEARYEKSQDQIDRLIAENERLREELAAAYVDQSGTVQHASDCATSNAPAMKPGACDCKENEWLKRQLSQIAWLAERPYDPDKQLTGGEGCASEGQAGSEA